MKRILIPTLFLFFISSSVAQHFKLGEKQFIYTAQINPSGFVFLKIGNMNRVNLDSSIPFCTIHYLNSEGGKSFQIIIQNDFNGVPILVGLDIALIQIYDCKNKFVYPINACIEKKKQSVLFKDEEDACIECLSERLNQCL